MGSQVGSPRPRGPHLASPCLVVSSTGQRRRGGHGPVFDRRSSDKATSRVLSSASRRGGDHRCDTDHSVGGMEIGGDDINGGWRWRTLGICAGCIAVLALADVSVPIEVGVTAALIPPMLVFAGTLLRGRPLAVIVTLSLADLVLLYGLAPSSGSRVEILIIGVIAVAAAGVGVWLRRHSVAPARAVPPDHVGPSLNGDLMLTGRLQQSPHAEQPDAALTLRLAGLSRREQDVARLVL